MTTDLHQSASSSDPTITTPRVLLREPALRMAILLSALPVKDRLTARCELVGRVACRQQSGSSSRSLYHGDSVVAQEIERIAGQLVEVFGEAPLPQHSWGDFAIAVSRELAKIETCARQWCDRWL